ncbi:MAG: cytochrome c family protein, partial [Pseudomonadota bacterium]
MDGYELNKIAAAILIAAIIAMVVSYITDGLYQPVLSPEQRGYQVAVTETSGSNVAEKEQEQIILGQLMAAADKEQGHKNFKKCAACHSVNKGGANKVGPNLYGIVNAKMAHLGDSFAYSKALLGKGEVWSYENLYHFLHKPRKYLPGTKMSFAGLKKPEDIADIIAYLRSNADNEEPFPEPERGRRRSERPAHR